MMIRNLIAALFPTRADTVAAASRWIDEDRKRRVAALHAARSNASRKGWAKRRAGA